MDRGVSQIELIDYLKFSEVNNVICMPETGNIIYDYLKSIKKCYKVNSLEEAVDISKKVTQINKICVLSPAASSYNDFRNFEEKGKIFKNLAKQINIMC